MSIVISWILVLCIVVIVAQCLRGMYHLLFQETETQTQTEKQHQKSKKTLQQETGTEVLLQATGTDGRVATHRPMSRESRTRYSSYEEYRRNNKIYR